MLSETSLNLFLFMKERQATYIRRFVDKSPPPWSEDRILQEYRFTNVYRELDATTIWLRENVRDPLSSNPVNSLFSTILFRWFNKIETGVAILGSDSIEKSLFCLDNFSEQAVDERVRKLPRWITGAYIIKTPDNFDKLKGVLKCVGNTTRHIEPLVERIQKTPTLENTTNLLQMLPYLGSFMAYEITTDLRHTELLKNASDILTWANPGPGAMRGVNRLMGTPIDRKLRTSYYLEKMREILKLSKNTEYWPNEGMYPPLEMRDIEHSLCEFDKYQRAKLGQGRPKQKFRAGGEIRPGRTVDPFFASLQEFQEN